MIEHPKDDNTQKNSTFANDSSVRDTMVQAIWSLASFLQRCDIQHKKPTHPLGELRVHHEVVYVFLGLGQLQLPGYHGNHQSRTARTLRKERGGEEEKTQHWVSQYREELVNRWLLAKELDQMNEGSEDKYEERSISNRRRSEWERGED